MQGETAWLLIATATIENIGAQSCLKAAQHGGFTTARRAAIIGLALVLLTSGLILYALSLEALELKAAYTVLVGGTVGGVAIVSKLFLRERFSVGHIVGFGLILLGVILVKLGSGGLSP